MAKHQTRKITETQKYRHKMYNRYRAALRAGMSKAYSLSGTARDKFTKGLAFCIKEVDDYGFSFFPEYYTEEPLKRLERYIEKA